MRKRRGIDLMPLPGAGHAGNSQPRDDNDEADNDAPGHETSLRGQHNQIDVLAKMMCTAAGIKPGFVQIRAFMIASSSISAFSLG
jgi:hypothetical protein